MFTLVHPSHVERTRVASAEAMLREVTDRVAMVTDEDLVALARGAETLGRHVDALRTRIAGEVDVRSDREAVARTDDDRLSSRYGCRNAVELLERTTRASVKTLRQRGRLDRHTRTHTTLTGHVRPARFPEVSCAFRSGTLSMDAACYLTDEFPRLERRGHTSAKERTIAEEEIIRATPTAIDGVPAHDTAEAPDDGVLPETFDEFRIVVDTWSTFLARDGIEPDAEYAERFRGLNLGRMRDGLVPVSGNLVPEAAAGLQLLFDAHNGSTTRFRTSPEDAPASAAWTDDEQVHDPRTAPQKRHDVLVSIIQTAAAATDTPSLGGAAPTLQISTTVGDLDDGTAILDRTQTPVPHRSRIASRAREPCRKSSSIGTDASSASVRLTASSTLISDAPSAYETAGASFRAAPFPPLGARSTMSPNTRTAAPPTPTTACCCAGPTITGSKGPGGRLRCAAARRT